MTMRVVSVLALFVLTSCNGGASDPKILADAASEALNAGDYSRSLEDFDAALTLMDRTHAQFLRASLGRCVALAHVDPARGKVEFLRLAADLGATITPNDVHYVVSAFVKAREFGHATDIMVKLKDLYPDSKEIQAIGDGVAAAARTAGDTVTVDRLGGHGYFGTAAPRRERVPSSSAASTRSQRIAEIEAQLARFQSVTGKDKFTEGTVLLLDCISVVLHPDGSVRLTSLNPGIPGTGDEITMTEQDGKMLVSVRGQFYCEWPVPSMNGIYGDKSVELVPAVQTQIEKRAAEAIALLRANAAPAK